MIVEKLNIFNFRSFDHSGMIYDLKNGMDEKIISLGNIDKTDT